MRYAWYLLELNPVPWTAPQVGTGRKGGRTYVQAYKSQELRTYQAAVKEEIAMQYPEIEPIKGPIDVEFYFWRQLPDYLSVNNVKVRKHQADATNMQKALEDALQGLLFANDRDVRSIHSHIIDQGFETEPQVLIGIRPHLDVGWPTEVTDALAKLRASTPDPGERPRHATGDDLF